MKILLRITLLLITLILLIGLTLASFYFYDLSVALTSKDFLKGDTSLDFKQSVPAVTPIKTWLDEIGYEDIEITSFDNLKLRGYYLKANKPTDKTAIIVHGYFSKAKEMSQYARFYYETLGYNVLMPDNRGHGESEGDYIGFGWHDRKDYLQWIDYIIANINPKAEIILHGVSMGGATVLMTSGETLSGNVKAIISDCAYTSVKAELSYQMKRMYNLPSFPLVNTTSLLTKIKAGYFFGEASAIKQVSKSNTPTLFIHGDKDTFVPYEMVYELYEACSSEKDLFVVPNATHATAYREDKEGYEKKISDFLNKYVK
ncbi:alpha/beta hydrolase [Clostridium sp. YIM B02506]|uniref:alpha/beta hydrolase n=1 Tax=Clostridium sp. YIM B02506 TaxID=2910680 RepID=UPI001EEE8F34|nr:alpha/beta hydrolase [Clostridium sp. YIM B02506]